MISKINGRFLANKKTDKMMSTMHNQAEVSLQLMLFVDDQPQESINPLLSTFNQLCCWIDTPLYS